MKYNVKIGEKTFEVEIADINQRPIVARVDGEEFAVCPEKGTNVAGSAAGVPAAATKPHAFTASPAGPSSMLLSATTLFSPLPGTVREVFVKPGDSVEAGMAILIIEAMKMKNTICSLHNGKVAQVLVSAGQTVGYKQLLVEFEP